MTDFIAARHMMVDGQVRTSNVTDLRLISAMLAVPRERFVPEARAGLAYLDLDLPVSEAAGQAGVRRLLKPMGLAKLIQAAEIGEDELAVKIMRTRLGFKLTTRGASHTARVLPGHIAHLAGHMIEKMR